MRLKIGLGDGDNRHQEDSGYWYYWGIYVSLCGYIAYIITIISIMHVLHVLLLLVLLLRSVQIQHYFLVWNHFSNIFFLTSVSFDTFGCVWEYGVWVFVSLSKFLLGRIALIYPRLIYFFSVSFGSSTTSGSVVSLFLCLSLSAIINSINCFFASYGSEYLNML